MSEIGQKVINMMMEDYERVIFYLLNKKFGHDVEEINVVMTDGVDKHEFKIKKPFSATSGGFITSHVEKIEYLSSI